MILISIVNLRDRYINTLNTNAEKGIKTVHKYTVRAFEV